MSLNMSLKASLSLSCISVFLCATSIAYASTGTDAELLKAQTQAIKSYNDHFKTSFQNQKEIKSDTSERLKNYFANLRACKAGTYEYATESPFSGYLYITAVINGQTQDQDHCSVDTSSTTPQGTTIQRKCQYSMQNLPLFTDDQVDSLMKGEVTISTERPLSELEKVTVKECHTSITRK